MAIAESELAECGLTSGTFSDPKPVAADDGRIDDQGNELVLAVDHAVAGTMAG